MSDKKINYLSRDFESIKEELLKFSDRYYPEITEDFNDSSVGSWFIDLVSAVGDDLSFHTDRVFQETDVNSASERSSVLNLARINGVKIPSAKASMCEVEISCVLPTKGKSSGDSIAQPNWEYAPIIQRTSIVTAGNNTFELTEDVNFAEQFNADGYSNRTIEPSRDRNGNITGYTVTKTTIVVNGNTRVYKKVVYPSDVKPFMEVVLPEQNVMNVESIIFKETSEYTSSPKIYEYYVDSEMFKAASDNVMTYRFFECDSLADQYRFGSEVKIDGNYVLDSIYSPHKYVQYNGAVESDSGTTRYYRGKWKPIRQKFITEFTDNGYMKIIFGSGNGYPEVPNGQTTYADYISSNLINNDMLGVLPKEGWSMYVLYRVGGGSFTNLGPGSINKIALANVDWGAAPNSTNGNERGRVVASLSVTNSSTALGGKDMPSTEEIRNLIKYNTASQNRAVTLEDYKAKLMQMPPKYGAPFRSSVAEINNKVEICVLGLNADGKLDSEIPSTLVDNILEYMSHYRQINDYIEVKSGRIYNIGVAIELIIDKNYNIGDVMKSVVNSITSYFDVSKRMMGEDIYLGDLEKDISLTDGVINLISLKIYKMNGGEYSSDVCPLPTFIEGDNYCHQLNQDEFSFDGNEQIDIDACDYVLYSDYNSMYEIYNPTSDIRIKCKTR